MTKYALRATATLLAFVMSSCSFAFHRDWKKATSAPGPHRDLSGAWEGTWHSVASGHHGTLKAIATPLDPQGPSTEYKFRYHATWGNVFSGGYTARHTVKREGSSYLLGGEQDLGKLFGGIYYYEGRATPNAFKATYRCDFDNGVFEMVRPAASHSPLPIHPSAPGR